MIRYCSTCGQFTAQILVLYAGAVVLHCLNCRADRCLCHLEKAA